MTRCKDLILPLATAIGALSVVPGVTAAPTALVVEPAPTRPSVSGNLLVAVGEGDLLAFTVSEGANGTVVAQHASHHSHHSHHSSR